MRPAGSIGMNGVFDRVREFHTVNGGWDVEVEGWDGGGFQGGCLRDSMVDLCQSQKQLQVEEGDDNNICISRDNHDSRDSTNLTHRVLQRRIPDVE